jgi:AraC family transcriptional regulator of adaptative response/methylated-DNA-[protein]-cysteine methyltransferase
VQQLQKNEGKNVDNSENIFIKLLDNISTDSDKNSVILSATQFDTPLGSMIAISDQNALYLLEFASRKGLESEIYKLKKNALITHGDSSPLTSIKNEIEDYFAGKLIEFKTPLFILGSTFQKKVWYELTKIPYGQTRSYLEQATALGNPTSYRAVANANGANQFAIIIPCHRVINNNGRLGGYGGGIANKQWLINFEKKTIQAYFKK